MGFSAARNLNFLLPILMALSVSCSKSSTKNQGTEDSGGGSAKYSTIDQVQAELDRALKLATRPDQQQNVFVQYWIDSGRKHKLPFIKVPSRLFPNLTDPGQSVNLRAPENTDKFMSPYLEALNKNKFDRKEKGDCLTTSAGEHKDASVSALNVGADICFSIGNLTRVPPSALLKEILGLLLHETIHLGGGSEAEATAWQTEFSAYFGLRFGDLTADTVSSNTFKALSSAKIIIGRAEELASTNARNPGIWGMMGRVAQVLAALPDLLDPLALELKTNPKNPKLIRNYQNAVLALIQKMQGQFDFRPTAIQMWASQTSVNFMTPEQMKPALEDMLKHLNQIEENFLAFVGGPEEARSVCILPAGDLDARIFGQSQQVQLIRMKLPPRTCAD